MGGSWGDSCGPGPRPFRDALSDAGLPDVGTTAYSQIAIEVVKSAIASLSDEDRELVSSRTAPHPSEKPNEARVDQDEWPTEFERRMTRWEQENAIANESAEEERRRRLDSVMPTATTLLVRTPEGEEGELLLDRGPTDDNQWWVQMKPEDIIARPMPRDWLTVIGHKITWDDDADRDLHGIAEDLRRDFPSRRIEVRGRSVYIFHDE